MTCGPEDSSEGQKSRGFKGSFVAFSECCVFFLLHLKEIVLQNFLMNWQTEGVNSNYRSAKPKEISPKKTVDISREAFAYFPSHSIFTE